jgi:FlaA1/EpsC-like NDP-sugar epimerase
MGEPVRIWDLAENMIRLAGLEPGRDVEVREVGLRPGEKLDEELMTGEEAARSREVRTKVKAVQCVPPERDLHEKIARLGDAARAGDRGEVLERLRDVVPEFTPTPAGPPLGG